MTWVWAMSGGRSGGLVVADVQVTFKTATGEAHHDLIRKLHYVAPSVVLAFAGSVKLGFLMVESLEDYARSHPKRSGDRLLAEWLPTARHQWSGAEPAEQAMKCHLLAIRASPPLGWVHLSRGWLIASPNFELEPFPPKGLAIPKRRMASIGSGSVVPTYESLLNMTGYQWWLRSEGTTVATASHPFAKLGAIVKDTVTADPIDGVSAHVHTGWLRHGDFELKTNDMTLPDGTSWKMPDVASTYDQFVELAKKNGYAIAAARA